MISQPNVDAALASLRLTGRSAEADAIEAMIVAREQSELVMAFAALLNDARAALASVADRIDDHSYSELSVHLDDSPLDQFGEEAGAAALKRHDDTVVGQELNRVANLVAKLAEPGYELDGDGVEDPVRAAFVDGVRAAYLLVLGESQTRTAAALDLGSSGS